MKQQLNILFITQEDFLAGSTYSVFFLARGLAAKGHRVFIAAREDSLLDHLATSARIEFFPITLKSRFDIKAIRQIKTVVKTYHVDVINAQSSKDRYVSVLSRWIYQLDTKIVHTRRQISLSVGGPLQNLFYVNGTDKIVAVGNGVKKSLEQGGVPEKHIKVIFNGTPAEKYNSLSEKHLKKLREKFDIKPNDLVIGCISRRKLQDQLLSALDHLDKPAKVILVGVIEDEQLKRIIKGFKLPHQVFFEGNIPSSDAINYLPLFSMSVLCSVTEGLSQSLLEAMYMGIPVIATKASGNTDVVIDGVNGFLFENGNLNELAHKITELDEDKLLWQRLSSEGRRTVKNSFTIEKTVSNYENFFIDLVSESEHSWLLHNMPQNS
ncbi:MAG: glycosyltransferase family 4 protein [Cyclobacteriaceae bacterium]